MKQFFIESINISTRQPLPRVFTVGSPRLAPVSHLRRKIPRLKPVSTLLGPDHDKCGLSPPDPRSVPRRMPGMYLAVPPVFTRHHPIHDAPGGREDANRCMYLGQAPRLSPSQWNCGQAPGNRRGPVWDAEDIQDRRQGRFQRLASNSLHRSQILFYCGQFYLSNSCL